METRKKRALGTFERAQAMTAERFAFNLVIAIRLAGALRRDALRRALDELHRRHALLRCRIAGSGRQRRFELGEAKQIPLRCVPRRSAEAWRPVVEEELAAGLGVGLDPLVQCVRVGSDGDAASEIVLTLHHAIVDAVSALHLVRELLALCAGDDAEQPSEQSLPPSADELLPAAYRAPRCWPASARFLAGQLADEVAYRWRTRDRRSPPAGPFRCRTLSLALSEEETTTLVRATRRERVGVSSALSAAMLLAVHRRRYENRSGPHRYFVFPLLRPYLSPPVPAEVVAGYFTTLRLTLAVEPESGLWRAAARIHRQSESAAKRGHPFLALRWSAFSMATMVRQHRQRMGTTALNYAGATSLEVDLDAPFSVEGFHAFVGNFPLGPEYTAQARIFDRRLCWDIVYLDVDMDHGEALAIGEEMRDTLLGAAGRPGSESA